MNCMKERIKKYLKLDKRPLLYKMAVMFYFLIRKLIPKKIGFEFTKCIKRPYFGPYLCAEQLWPNRYPTMSQLINQELMMASSSYKILEIGSWAGQSAILWASVCKGKKKGKVFVIDTWESSDNVSEAMKQAVKKNKIFKLFLHNIEASGVKDYIVPIKGSSDTVADILKPETFDFVYIDGDHAYTQFKKDLLNYMKVVKINGVICGDDLELHPNGIDILNAKKHCEDDYIFDPRFKKYFHPGIALGINEVFGNVSMKNGFWAIRRVKSGWKPVNL